MPSGCGTRNCVEHPWGKVQRGDTLEIAVGSARHDAQRTQRCAANLTSRATSSMLPQQQPRKPGFLTCFVWIPWAGAAVLVGICPAARGAGRRGQVPPRAQPAQPAVCSSHTPTVNAGHQLFIQPHRIYSPDQGNKLFADGTLWFGRRVRGGCVKVWTNTTTLHPQRCPRRHVWPHTHCL